MLSRLSIKQLLCISILGASNYVSAQFNYNNGAEITGCSGGCQSSNLVIPDTINGNVVFRIGYEAFRDMELSSVTIPEGVLSIGHSAFADNELTSILIPNSVIHIEDGAFDANQLTSLSIGSNVVTIGRFSFMDNQLTTVSIPNNVVNIDSHAFRENYLQSISISENVEVIGDEVFRDNQLSCVNIPDSVVEIGHRAFMNNQLTSVVIPHNVDIIGDFAFYNDYPNRNRFQLDSVHFKGDRPIIGSAAFSSENPNFSLNRVTYCSNTSGWPGAPIQGITPELDPLCVTPPVTQLVCPIVSTPVTPPVTPPVCPIVPMGYTTFDIDQNGSVDALSDGLILLRYFFGLRDDALVNDVVSPDASTTSAADIEAYIESHMP
jgi:hypothetical protein